MPASSQNFPSPPSREVLLIGPTTAVGEQLLEVLGFSHHPPRIVGADTGEAVGRSFEWRGETQTVVDLSRVQGRFDAVLLAAPAPRFELPAEARVVFLPGGGRQGRLVLPGVAAPLRWAEHLRTPDPLAVVISTTLSALTSAIKPAAVEVTAFEAASNVGRAGMDELRDQTIDLLNFRDPKVEVFSRRLAFDLLPRAEEVENEFIQDLMELHPGLGVVATRVLVPAFVGVAAAVRISGSALLDEREIRRLLEADQRFVVDDAPGLAATVGGDAILVSPPRVRAGVLHLWLVADDTRFGSALPAVKLLERLDG